MSFRGNLFVSSCETRHAHLELCLHVGSPFPKNVSHQRELSLARFVRSPTTRHDLYV